MDSINFTLQCMLFAYMASFCVDCGKYIHTTMIQDAKEERLKELFEERLQMVENAVGKLIYESQQNTNVFPDSSDDEYTNKIYNKSD